VCVWWVCRAPCTLTTLLCFGEGYVCMCVCVCVCVCVCATIFAGKYTCYGDLYTCVCMHVCVCLCVCESVSVVCVCGGGWVSWRHYSCWLSW